jgi:hypothetical protein
MKDLRFVTVCPDDTYFTWQVHLWLESLKEIGQSDKAIVLLYIPQNRNKNVKWQQIINLYPEAEFHFYKDDAGALNSHLSTYIPILRPWTMWSHFKANPELSNKAIFYCDSDILFTKDFNVDKLIEDGVCYLSNTNSYINSKYFESKIRDVIPSKLEEYKTRDILAEIMSVVGVDKQVAIDNNEHSGGAQYLLKDIDATFWNKVMNDCMIIRKYLQKVNKDFFENESKGYQSWCADMWAVLWNIWFRGQETKVVDEMNFSWATDPISKLEKSTIFHNAGIVSPHNGKYNCFYKGKYHNGNDPTADPHLDNVLNDEESKKYCTWFYANKLKELKTNYNLNY